MLLHTLPQPTPALGLFAWMADCLRAAIAPHTSATTVPGRLLHFVYFYLPRTLTRLAALHQRWRDGTLRPTAPARPRTPRPERAPALLFGHPRPRLPRAHNWLVKQVQRTAIGHGQLHAILNDPEFATFLAAVPRAARLLRPLCAALGLTPPAALQIPPRKRRPTPPKAPRPPRITAAERRHLLTYSPGPLRHLRKPA